MNEQLQIQPEAQVERSGSFYLAAPDVACLQIVMVNVYFVGYSSEGRESWTLVDAGLPMSAGKIIAAAEQRFGQGARPRAIVLTHGHFDHVGALKTLVEHWDVPVYAHTLELPFLTGRANYPPPDPTVGGGMLARTAKLYPRRGIDLGGRVSALPTDDSVPTMSGWRWIHTPGHCPGHVSLFRESDRVLIAGDAFITTQQESLLAVLTQDPQMHGPPMYFTTDWLAAAESVRRLAEMHPFVAATGHGIPMQGPEMESALQNLAENFEEIAVPRDGRYVRAPAIADETGYVWIPPALPDYFMMAAGAIAAGALVGAALMSRRRDA